MKNNEIPTIPRIINNESDLVIGSRFLDDSEKEIPQYRKAGIKIITKITNASIKKQLTDSQSGFRAYSRKVLNELHGIPFTVQDDKNGILVEPENPDELAKAIVHEECNCISMAKNSLRLYEQVLENNDNK